MSPLKDRNYFLHQQAEIEMFQFILSIAIDKYFRIASYQTYVKIKCIDSR